MKTPHFFGYGSLVNLRTHDYPRPQPAIAKGWRRAWVTTPARPFAFLTAVKDASCIIEGLIAEVPRADWAALDLREAAYERLHASHDVSVHGAHFDQVAIYAVPDPKPASGNQKCKILLSYLDVVIQGYLAVHGQSGVARFVETTSAWTAEIHDDRNAPVYPRYCKLSAEESALVDSILNDLGCKKVSA